MDSSGRSYGPGDGALRLVMTAVLLLLKDGPAADRDSGLSLPISSPWRRLNGFDLAKSNKEEIEFIMIWMLLMLRTD